MGRTAKAIPDSLREMVEKAGAAPMTFADQLVYHLDAIFQSIDHVYGHSRPLSPEICELIGPYLRRPRIELCRFIRSTVILILLKDSGEWIAGVCLNCQDGVMLPQNTQAAAKALPRYCPNCGPLSFEPLC